MRLYLLRATGILLPLLLTGCAASAHEESRVRSVDARINGLTCVKCVPPLTASLRRHFDKAAAIEVDDDRDTATVRFDPQQEFTPAAFQDAVAEVRMQVVDLSVEACGRLEPKGSQRWMTAGSNRFLVESDRQLPIDQPVCLRGRLDGSQDQLTLNVTTFELQHP
jgi:hypothetical protein